MNRREVAVWTFASYFWLTIIVAVIWDDSSRPEEAERPVPPQGVMEKKFHRLNKDMTRAEVEAILGEPIVGSWSGGSKTPCERFDYTWRGDDGEILIYYAYNPNDKMVWGPPGKDNRIKTMSWHPSASPAFRGK